MENFFILLLSLALLIILSIVIIIEYHRQRMYRKYEEELKEKIKQVGNLEALGEMASGTAHDFNNILAAICGAADCLKKKTADNEEIKKYAEVIVDASQKASVLTRNLLSFACKKQSKSKIADLHNCLEKALLLLEHGIDKKIVIKKDFSAAEQKIKADENQLENMILNLGFNARDAISGSGMIFVKTRNVSLDDRIIEKCLIKIPAGRYVELEFRDTGCGIAPEIQNRIFEQFFTTKDKKGTGIGLPTVYKTICESSGTLRFETSNKGTSFYIYFPVKMKISIIHRCKIIVADDENLFREITSDILQQNNCDVVCAADGAQAIEFYEKNKDAAAIVMDALMPQKNGMEVYEEIRKRNSLIKVIFMSGRNLDDTLANILKKDKFSDAILKPYFAEELIEKLAILLAKE